MNLASFKKELEEMLKDLDGLYPENCPHCEDGGDLMVGGDPWECRCFACGTKMKPIYRIKISVTKIRTAKGDQS